MFKSIKKRLKDQRGLTLVELLAVVVILGIIAGIAVPNIGKIIDKTENDAKVAEGIQIIQAAKLYATSNKLTLTDDLETTGTTADTFYATSTQLGDYLDNVKDTNLNYKVKIKKTGNKYVYSLLLHDASVVLGEAAGAEVSETKLLAY